MSDCQDIVSSKAWYLADERDEAFLHTPQKLFKRPWDDVVLADRGVHRLLLPDDTSCNCREHLGEKGRREENDEQGKVIPGNHEEQIGRAPPPELVASPSRNRHAG